MNSQTRIDQRSPLARAEGVLVLGLLALLALANGAHAAATPASADAPVPKSVFVMPTGPQEGKDPFFPKSQRPYQTAAVATPTTNRTVVPTSYDLKLNGISGTPEHPLAIINGKTFEQGEEGEVRVGPARVNIRVVEIKANTVTVQAGTQQQVLRMRGGF